jgi:pimeloyl-ACP methyl ester carboxylesterase/class 3 adenylate cyclase
MIERPDTRYAVRGDTALAYQVLGEGDDLVYLPDFGFNVEGNWDMPLHARFLDRLASFSRLTVMDRRGFGCSDRLPSGQATPLEEYVDDLIAVTEAAYCTRSVLFGVGVSGFISMLAAASHPDRFSGLILFDAAPCWTRTEETPWAWSDDEWEEQFAFFRNATRLSEYADAYVRDAARSLLGDRLAIRQLATLFALTATPRYPEGEVRAMAKADLRQLLPSLRVPTLVLHRTESPTEPVQSARFLAERIPGATLVELPGSDALPWIGEPDPVLDEVETFVTGTRPEPDANRMLATVLFTDIVGSTEHLAKVGDARWSAMVAEHDERVRACIATERGMVVDHAGDGFFAIFDGPARGIRAAAAAADAVRPLGLEIRAGLHTAEVERAGAEVRGIGVHVGARIAALADPSHVWVSQTTKDLVAGSGLTFHDLGERELKGVPQRWRLHRLSATAP